MKALITGASSGMGRDMARVLASQGYDLIIAARRKDKLDALAEELDGNVQVICCDISDENECRALFDHVKDEPLDIAINNAGFGAFGAFDEVDLSRELKMLDTNVRAVHILTKLFIEKFSKQGYGHLMNVASSAGFFAGPLMSTYYATKSYVLRYSEALAEELRRRRSPVKISVLCPGPVGTEFGSVANVAFSMKGLDSMNVARYAIRQMQKGKLLIVPGMMMKSVMLLRHFLPDVLLNRAVYHIQKRKCTTKR